MMHRLAAVLCLATAAHAAKKPSFQKIPEFYTSTDCSGSIDPASKTWGMTAGNGGTVQPFATEGSYIYPWVFDECLWGGGSATYSLKLVIDTSACTSGNETSQLMLYYYAGSTTCATTPAATTLTLDGTCLQYPLGSVKITPEIPLSDICIATNYVTVARAGGVRTRIWSNGDCSGTPDSTSTDTQLAEKKCAAQPECQGCCRDYDDQCQPEVNYTMSRSACKMENNNWRMAMRVPEYTDASCTNEAVSFWNDTVIEFGVCNQAWSEGSLVSVILDFVNGMSNTVQCELIGMALRNDIDESIVSWDTLNSGHGLAPNAFVSLVLVVATVLATVL